MPPSEEDLEATAELPAIEFAPEDRDPDRTVITDIFSAQAIPAAAPEPTDHLREMQQELQRERGRMQEVEAQLHAATGREAGLQARLAEAEQQLREAGYQRSELEGQLIEMSDQRSALAARVAETDARCLEIEAQLRSRVEPTPQVVVARHESADITELRRCAARQLEALGSWYGFRALSDSVLAEVEARNAQLETQVATLGDSLRLLERKHHAAPVLAPRDGENQALKMELVGLKAEFSALQSLLASVRERQQQSERVAEAEAARARRLESEAQASASLFGNTPQGAERDRQLRETAIRHAATQVLPAEPRRVLIRLQGGSEVVYPIGRRTTIGRMPDNDIQLDTTNVSRHHAVVLSNAEHCIIEDLNSTNGVLVNGRRVTRQLLHDGDSLSVGKTEFRFLQRS